MFMTALIYHLLERGSDGLHAFANKGLRVYPGAKCVHRHASTSDAFPYESHLAALRSDKPKWPVPTDQEHHFSLIFRYRVNCPSIRHRMRRWRRMFRATGKVRLDIYDYPGEFLYDVSASRMSYLDWSELACKQIVEHALPEGDEYQKRLAGLNDMTDLGALRTAYSRYAAAARQKGLFDVVPAMAMLKWHNHTGAQTAGSPPSGVMVESGRPPSEDELPFLPIPREFLSATQTAVRATMEQRFRQYREEKVDPFVEQVRKSDTHLVLVDVLQILQSGDPKVYNGVRACLTTVLDVLCERSIWTHWRRPFGLMFAAPKADQAPGCCRHQLTHLLDSLVTKAKRAGPQLSVPVKVRHFASVRATKDDSPAGTSERRLVKGIELADDEREEAYYEPYVFSGEWPTTTEAWNAINRKGFPSFEAPRLPVIDGAPLPHLSFDEVLYEIIAPVF